MFSKAERDLLTNLQDLLLELYVLRDEAIQTEDWERAQELQEEIDQAERERQAIRRFDTIGAA